MTQKRSKRMNRMRMRIIFNRKVQRLFRQIVSRKGCREENLIRWRMILAKATSAILMDPKILRGVPHQIICLKGFLVIMTMPYLKRIDIKKP
jgi:hypothetical protein